MADRVVTKISKSSKFARTFKSKRSKRKARHKNSDSKGHTVTESFDCAARSSKDAADVFNYDTQIPHAQRTPNGSLLNYQILPNNMPLQINNPIFSEMCQKVHFLDKQVMTLQEENLKLKNALYTVKHFCDDSFPPIDIVIKNGAIAERFLPDIARFLTDLLSTNQNNTHLANFNTPVIDNDQVELPRAPAENAELFLVDNSPITKAGLFENLPRYDTQYHGILQPKGKTEDNNESENIQKKTCFNCFGDHFMNQCPHKANQFKIRKNKQNFHIMSKRYHVHGDQSSNFKPGVISNELRKALGLKQNQVPFHVYNMRLLGYPPGWLLEAEVEQCTIRMYDNEGKDKASEDQEKDVTARNNSETVKYESEVLIDYAGFNCPLPPDCIDETVVLGYPPYQEHLWRSFVEQYAAPGEPKLKLGRKRKPETATNMSVKVQRCEEDMEVEDEDLAGGIFIVEEDSDECPALFIPPLPPQDSYPPPPLPDMSPPPLPQSPPPPLPESPPPLPPGVTDMLYTVVLPMSDVPLPKTDVSAPLPATPMSPDVLPPDTPASPDVLPPDTPASPDVLPPDTPVSPDVLSPDTPASPDATPPDALASPDVPPPDDSSLLDDESISICSAIGRFKEKYGTTTAAGDVSPSLLDLEEMKKKLLMELNDAALLADDDSLGGMSSPRHVPSPIADLDNETSSPTGKGAECSGSGSLSMSFGTPSLSRHSSFTKLPKYEKFSKDVSDHIPYENLPNATGTYRRMKGVLKRVKDKLNALMH